MGKRLATVALKGNFFFYAFYYGTFMLALKKRHFVGSLSTWTPSGEARRARALVMGDSVDP